MMKTLSIAPVLAVLLPALPAHADEVSFADAKSNFELLCKPTPNLKETCGVALQYGFDVALLTLEGCIAKGARGDEIPKCVQSEFEELGFIPPPADDPMFGLIKP